MITSVNDLKWALIRVIERLFQQRERRKIILLRRKEKSKSKLNKVRLEEEK
jgi:hypothetical protein